MTPSEKEELLRTVGCQGKEYSQGQTDPHLVISKEIRREYLVSMVNPCSLVGILCDCRYEVLSSTPTEFKVILIILGGWEILSHFRGML